MKQINEHFEITENAEYELVSEFVCKITSKGTLKALTKGARARAYADGSVAKAGVEGAIAEAWVDDGLVVKVAVIAGVLIILALILQA